MYEKSSLTFFNQDGGEVRTFGNEKIRKENTLEVKDKTHVNLAFFVFFMFTCGRWLS